MTTGYLNDTQPVFDPEGKYLFYASDRAFDPIYGSFDGTWTYANPTQLVAVPLRKDVKSPLVARNDDENPALDTDKKPDEKKPDEKKPDEGRPRTKTSRRQDSADKPAATRRRRTSTSISTASKRAPSSCRPRPATTPICRR